MFGQRLRLARKRAGLSMRALSEAMSPKVTARAISKYEAGKMLPSSTVLVGLGMALDVSPADSVVSTTGWGVPLLQSLDDSTQQARKPLLVFDCNFVLNGPGLDGF